MVIKTPAKNGIPQVGSLQVLSAYSINPNEAYVLIAGDICPEGCEIVMDPAVIASFCKPTPPTPQELQGKMLANLMLEVAKINAKLGGTA